MPEHPEPVFLPPPRLSLRTRLRGSHGVRSGVLVGAATLVASVAGYLFQTAAIRFVGAASYSDIATLLALTTVIAVPLGSVQTLLARETAYLSALQAKAELRGFIRQVLRIAVPAAVAVLAISLAFSVPIEHALNIESPEVVIAGLSALPFLILGAILYGFLQGTQRFRALAVNYSVSGLARPLLVVPVLFASLGAAGALGVNTLAALGAVALAVYALRDLLFSRGAVAPAPTTHHLKVVDRREVAVLMVGSLAFASLTNLDIVLASYYLDSDAAGVYAAAALVGKFVLLMPAAVSMVLLPKAASQAASGRDSRRILLLSAGVSLAITLTATAVLAVTPARVMVWAFGPDFAGSAELLGWFGLAMTAAALVNVYLFVYLAHKDLRFPLLVGTAAVAQVVIVALWHPDPRAIVLSTVICCTAVMAIHEVAFPNRLARLLRRRGGVVPPAPPPPGPIL